MRGLRTVPALLSVATDNKAGTVLNPLMIPPIPKVSPIVCFSPYFAGISKSITVEGPLQLLILKFQQSMD